MKKCPSCGKRLASDVFICTRCGITLGIDGKKVDSSNTEKEQLYNRIKNALGPLSDTGIKEMLDFAKELKTNKQTNKEKFKKIFGPNALDQFGIKEKSNGNIIFANTPEEAAQKSMQGFYGDFINAIAGQERIEKKTELTIIENEKDILIKKGENLLKQWKLSEALRCFNNILIKFGRDVEVYALRAETLFKRGLFEQAINNCKNALKLNPNYSPALKIKKNLLSLKEDQILKIIRENILSDRRNRNTKIDMTEVEKKVSHLASFEKKAIEKYMREEN